MDPVEHIGFDMAKQRGASGFGDTTDSLVSYGVRWDSEKRVAAGNTIA